VGYQQKILTRLLSITWYVYIGEKLSNAQFTVRYIGRYTKRPAIAESRIIGYDGNAVTFNFVDHKTETLTYHTLAAQEFIGKLIRHIPDENFRIIRYSGFYANRVRGTLLPKVFTLLNQNFEKAKERLATLSSWWRKQIERFTKLDPLVCPFWFERRGCCSPQYKALLENVWSSTKPDSSCGLWQRMGCLCQK
jgi:hypothetical protein